MEFSEQALILQVGRFKEADLWIRFLSPSRGILSAFAFGGSRSRRRFPGCLDVFNEVLVKARSSRQGAYLALQEGVLLRGSRRLRADWARFGLAANCAKFLQCFGVGSEGADKVHLVMRQLLQLLEEVEAVSPYVPFLFRARVAFDQGYALSPETCAGCGCSLADRGARFSIEEGRLFCPSCAPRLIFGRLMNLGPAALALLAAVQQRAPGEWIDPACPERDLADCSRALDAFVCRHVGLTWEKGRFARV
ncbi:MAG: recombination protein O N-terminal domain-containing protein [Desulfovibrio sp.]|jgi:DNA repair protein RecO (recombination protein O)|nr:recombination protein O N-terminal domain-containing protein [Desulfovibrio sp.]